MNTGRPKGNQKHLDLSARIIIEQHLNNGDSFRSIAIELSKDPSTISKEIRRHSIIRERSADAFAPIPCANNYDSSKPRTNICNVMHMCGDNECRRKCVLCRKFRCSDVCKFYKPRECEKLNKPPYVCNGCSKRTNCMMDKKIYSSKYAQDSYEALRTTSREGINQTPESIQKLDNLLSPLLKKGQSIAPVSYTHLDVYKRQLQFPFASYQHVPNMSTLFIGLFSQYTSIFDLFIPLFVIKYLSLIHICSSAASYP